MSSLEIGSSFKKTSWCSAEIICHGDCPQFTDSGAGVKVYHLYNVSGCSYITKSSLIVDIRHKGNTKWEPWKTYTMGGYEGYAYYYIVITNGIDYEFKVTYKGITKYYSIVSPDTDLEEGEPIMSECITSPRIYTGETFVHHYANIGIEDLNSNSVIAKVTPLGMNNEYEVLPLNTPVKFETEDYNLTITTQSISLSDTGSAIFKLCWEPKVTPPETCTQTFKLQDQDGNPLNGNVKVGTTNITVLGTGTIVLEKGKAYTAVASFSDKSTQSKTFTACTTTTFVFNVVPDVGLLNITTDPSGANITINFVPYGVTPQSNIELPLGNHTVTLKLDQYRSITKFVTLEAGIPGIISETMTSTIKLCTQQFKIQDQNGAPLLLPSVISCPDWDTDLPVPTTGLASMTFERYKTYEVTAHNGVKTNTVTFTSCQSSPVYFTIQVDVPDPEPEPDPEPGGYIGEISHEFSGDEIKVFVPITNIWTKETCFYLDLRDQSGSFIEKAPMLLQTVKLSPGETGTIIIDSYGAINPSWNVTDVQGQSVSLELKGIASILGVCSLPPVGYTIVHTKPYDIPMPPEPEPEPEPEPDDPPVYGTGTIGAITKEIIQQVGNDEVKFSIPVTNNTSKEQCYIVKLYNEAGDYIAKTPTSIVPGQMANKIMAGGTETMILNSDGQFWHINDIQGQTVTFKLYGDPSFLTICPYLDSGYSVVDSKVFVMESYTDPDKDVFDPGDLLGVDPLLEVPMVNVNKVVFKGLGNPNETIYIYQDQSLEFDDLITSFECGPDGKYSGEYDFNTGSYKLYAKKSGALGKESERHTVLVIDVIHLVLLVVALGLTIWKIRRK